MTTKSAPLDEDLSVIGIDIGKDVFHIVGFDQDGTIVLRRMIKRLGLVGVFKKLPRCVVGLEACLSAHFVSRTLRQLGFEHVVMLTGDNQATADAVAEFVGIESLDNLVASNAQAQVKPLARLAQQSYNPTKTLHRIVMPLVVKVGCDATDMVKPIIENP